MLRALIGGVALGVGLLLAVLALSPRAPFLIADLVAEEDGVVVAGASAPEARPATGWMSAVATSTPTAREWPVRPISRTVARDGATGRPGDTANPLPVAPSPGGPVSPGLHEQPDPARPPSLTPLPPPAPVVVSAQGIGGPTALLAATPTPVGDVVAPADAVAPADLPPLGAGVPSSVRRWAELIVRWSQHYGVDPNLVAALMMTESEGNPDAVSPMGAIGLMQVMGGSFEPDENVRQGVAILAGHLARYGGDPRLALAAYNAGSGNVRDYDGVPPFWETRSHVFRVLTRYELYRQPSAE